MYPIVDTHAHLGEMEEIEGVIERARGAGVVAIVAVGSDPQSNERVLEIAAKYSGFVYPALGLHPWSLGTANFEPEESLRFIEDNIENIVAIGEIGLDYHKELIKRASKDRQKWALEGVLGLARRYDKPAIIHSRYAWRDTFELASRCGVKEGIFHWYTGPLNVLRNILEQGYLASATPAVEYHEEHRTAIKEVPLESLLLETDSPVVYRGGGRAEPRDVLKVLHSVAKLRDVEPGKIADKTTENAMRIFHLIRERDG